MRFHQIAICKISQTEFVSNLDEVNTQKCRTAYASNFSTEIIKYAYLILSYLILSYIALNARTNVARNLLLQALIVVLVD